MMKTKKFGVIFMVLLLSLSMVGVAQALWFETLTFEGTVNTGTVDMEWTLDEDCYDDEEKDEISSVSAVIDGNTLTITVNNAYPCVTYTVPFDLHCVGTIPIHTALGTIDVPPVNEVELELEYFKDQARTVPYEPLEILFKQWHQSDTAWGRLTIHLTNEAIQGHTYTFSILADYHQYNETP